MSAKPTAQGTLGKTPFAHLLLYVHDRRLTGTLAIWPERNAESGRGQDRLFFQTGSVVAMRALGSHNNTQDAVVALFARLDGPYGFYADQNLLGSSDEILRGAIDTYTALGRGLLLHARDDVVDALLARVGTRPIRVRSGLPLPRLGLEPAQRAFVERLQTNKASVDELLREGKLSASEIRRIVYLLTLIRGIETAEDQAQVSGLTMVSMPPPQESTSPPSEPSHLRLDVTLPGTRPAPAPSIRAPSSPSVSAPGMITSTSIRVPGAVSSRAPSAVGSGTGKVTPSAMGNGSASGTGTMTLPAPPPPAGLSHHEAARWNELASAYDALDERNHYQLLGVPPNASTADISSAYFGLVKKFHPDRLSTTLAPLERCAQQLFDRLTEANQTLSNAESRAEYDKAVADGGGTRAAERMMRNVIDSALEFQKAEVLMKRRDFAQAMQHLRNALNKNPDEPDYHALYGWLLHLMNPGEPAPLEEIMQSLDRAIKANSNSERTHYYRGVVLKRLKREREALYHFRTAMEINPRNVDAAREVRLATMRRESKPPPPGLLSKFFKGPKD